MDHRIVLRSAPSKLLNRASATRNQCHLFVSPACASRRNDSFNLIAVGNSRDEALDQRDSETIRSSAGSPVNAPPARQ